MQAPYNEPIVTTSYGESTSVAACPPYEIVYINKLAMTLVDAADLGYASADTRSVMGKKSVIEAKMRSACRVNFPK